MDEKNIDLEPPVDLPVPTAQKMEVRIPDSPNGQEQAQAIALEQGISLAMASPVQDPASTTQAVAPAQASTPPAASAPIVNVPERAEDSDLIEKEWVAKAKQIVERTKDDPYVQNKEISKVKAEYIKRRYNKDLKLSDN